MNNKLKKSEDKNHLCEEKISNFRTEIQETLDERDRLSSTKKELLRYRRIKKN
jgi:hypothetical protein